eukprot:scaffold177814_cov22-Prasinocladus_malaysianus.AAC.1
MCSAVQPTIESVYTLPKKQACQFEARRLDSQAGVRSDRIAQNGMEWMLPTQHILLGCFALRCGG